MKLRTLLCYLVFLSSQLLTSREIRVNLQEQLQQKLDSLHEKYELPGIVFSAVLPGGEQINMASGVADSLSMAPMTPSHRMLSGSNGKTLFLATALILETNGHFELDDRISEFIGDEEWFSRLPNAETITMRMLMNHSSGLEEYYPLGDFMQQMAQDPSRRFTPLETFSYVFDREPLFEAGTSWSYADTNFLLLAYILEKISEMEMYELIEEHLLLPYELEATEPSVKQEFDLLATGYSGSFSPFPFHGAMVKDGKLVFNPQFEWAGGGFVSNASDLARWVKELYHLPVISEENREAMREGVPAATGRDHQYGLGLQIRPGGDLGTSYGHSGWFPGYITDAAYFPDADLSLAIQMNTDDLRGKKISAYALLMELAEVLE